MLRYFIITLILPFITTAMASPPLRTPSPFPRGCEVSGFAYYQNYLILNEHGQQVFYMIQNRSTQPIELEHYETKDVFMSPKLHTKLDATHWGAFASDIPSEYFTCKTQRAGNAELINCKDVLNICQYPRAKFALSNMGNYWISTNKPQGQVIRDSAAKGIFLHW